MTEPAGNNDPAGGMRQRILETASSLFYEHGVRAIGVDLVVERAGIAKTSLYRHFRTKDELVAAFLEREDAAFWQAWDDVAARHRDDPEAELLAHMGWIAERVARPGYRGCPQINVAAEFPESGHPARQVEYEHKREMRRRIQALGERMQMADPAGFSASLSVFINGAFVSSRVLDPGEAKPVLADTAAALLSAYR
ncbi:TetR/AcrR family transcriptional regulator [Synechococcus moorigangaii CMS01]|jgi:AcrR family transcriptional regulator|nr:TetR/AcrR family transcriptional regulator [Synechococcus moorigangaii CMS01]